jgi:ectoine hydroxylase-related dioxygenase (phytanoyl-CoA dioxygenase family)
MTLEIDGFQWVPGLFSEARCNELIDSLEVALAQAEPTIRGSEGKIYAARNLLEVWSEARSFWKTQAIQDSIVHFLGAGAGLVRMLYFDKPPGQSWALPWHQDRTIAIRVHPETSHRYRNPTRKAGVCHIEAPVEVLEHMIILRIHLDAMTAGNGPLKVIAGSHRWGKSLNLTGEVRTLLASPGDGLLMRPLLAHCSGRSAEGTQQHRRIVHLEFAASQELPEQVEWHTFLPVG